MAHPLRSVRVAHFAATLAAAGVFAAAACGGSKPDHAAPVFAGLESATVVAPGTARLAWSAASDRSAPVTYEIFRGDGSHAEDLVTPVATTDALTLDVSGLPPGMRPSWFVVRARDAHGNADDNYVEQSVAFASNRLSQLGHISQPHFETSDIAVNSAGNLVAMGGFISSPQVRAYLFDVSSAGNPVQIATLYGAGRSTDVEIRGDYLYVATEQDSTVPKSGVYIYDLSNPAAVSQTPVSTITGVGLGQCHTIWIDGTMLYCASSDDGYIHLVDVTDPLAPVAKGKVGFPGGQIHDMYVKDGFAVGCFLWDGFFFFDATDPMNPVLGSQVAYDGAFTHNAWPTPDLQYLYTTDEIDGGHLRIWDIRNRANVTQVGEFRADPGPGPHAIVHNVQIVDGYAWVSWYEAGVQVLDVTDPVNPTLVGSFDSYTPATTGNYDGAWGIAPRPPFVYVSDLDAGFFALELAPAQ